MKTNDPYVPPVGHLVDHDGLSLIVMRSNKKDTLLLTHNGGTIEVFTKRVKFLADRSKEWKALFQLDNTPKNED